MIDNNIKEKKQLMSDKIKAYEYTFNTTLPKEVLAIYWNMIKEHDIPTIEKAFNLCFTESNSAFLPAKLAEKLKMLSKKDKTVQPSSNDIPFATKNENILKEFFLTLTEDEQEQVKLLAWEKMKAKDLDMWNPPKHLKKSYEVLYNCCYRGIAIRELYPQKIKERGYNNR